MFIGVSWRLFPEVEDFFHYTDSRTTALKKLAKVIHPPEIDMLNRKSQSD